MGSMQTPSQRSIQFQIGLATFGILVLELALIRWTSQQVPIFAYVNNLTLMAAFLGMGLGVALGARRPDLQHWTLPALALFSIPIALSEQLDIMHLNFPDLSMMLWGGESWTTTGKFVVNVLTLLVLFAASSEFSFAPARPSARCSANCRRFAPTPPIFSDRSSAWWR